MSVVGLDRAVLFRLATSERLERAVKILPVGETMVWRAASRYVAGRSRGQALATATTLLERGHAVSVDLFGERLSDPGAADRVVEDYVELAGALPPLASEAWLSVDLTHLALDTDASAVADRLVVLCYVADFACHDIRRRIPSLPRTHDALDRGSMDFDPDSGYLTKHY
jgi:proline dehydrogenase